MSSRDELREALNLGIRNALEHGIRNWYERINGPQPNHSAFALAADDILPALLAVLDQQGWVSPAEAAAHKAFYDLTVAQRNHAWAESARHKAERDAALREAARHEPTSFGDPWHPWNVEYVAQEHPNGCGIACLAMVARMTYAEVRGALAVEMPRERDYGEEGIHSGIVENFLGRRGFAWRSVYSGWRLDEWPPAPFAPIHIAQVKQPSGYTHFVVMLADGSVYDPLSVEERTLADWSEVNNVFGFWPLYRRVTTAGED